MRIIRKLLLVIGVITMLGHLSIEPTYASSIVDTNTVLAEEEFNLDDEITKDFTVEVEDENAIKATEPTKARGTLIENVGVDNNPYPIRKEITSNSIVVNNDTNKSNASSSANRISADSRQFLTFTTKSGKVFHLIVNHDNDSENVQLLTEVSEQDLLNMIDTKDSKNKVAKKETVKKATTPPLTQEDKAVEKKQEKKQDNSLFIILALMVVAAGIYFFKFKKKKVKKNIDVKEDEFEDDFFSDIQDSKENIGNEFETEDDLEFIDSEEEK